MKNIFFSSKKSQNICKSSSLALRETILHEGFIFLSQNQRFHMQKFGFCSFGTDFTCEIKYFELWEAHFSQKLGILTQVLFPSHTFSASSSHSSIASSWAAVSWSICCWLSMSSAASLVACIASCS